MSNTQEFNSGLQKYIHKKKHIKELIERLGVYQFYEISRKTRKSPLVPSRWSNDLSTKVTDPSFYHLPKSKFKIDQIILKICKGLVLESDFELSSEVCLTLRNIATNEELCANLHKRYSDSIDLYISALGSIDGGVRIKVGLSSYSLIKAFEAEYLKKIQGPFCNILKDEQNPFRREDEQLHLSSARFVYGNRLIIGLLEYLVYLELKKTTKVYLNQRKDSKVKLLLNYDASKDYISFLAFCLEKNIWGEDGIIFDTLFKKRLILLNKNFQKLELSIQEDLNKICGFENLLCCQSYSLYDSLILRSSRPLNYQVLVDCKSYDKVRIVNNLERYETIKGYYLGKISQNSNMIAFVLDQDETEEVVIIDLNYLNSIQINKPP